MTERLADFRGRRGRRLRHRSRCSGNQSGSDAIKGGRTFVTSAPGGLKRPAVLPAPRRRSPGPSTGNSITSSTTPGTVTEQRYGDITLDSPGSSTGGQSVGRVLFVAGGHGPMIGRRFGRIVNIGSVSATMGSPVQIPYAAAKSGLIGLTRSTARAVAAKRDNGELRDPGQLRHRSVGGAGVHPPRRR